jgi:hypothetical protein
MELWTLGKSINPGACDSALKIAAESHTFIWLQGDFQFGKTSLFRRHASWLSEGWFAVYADMAMFDRSTEIRFRRDFFAELDEATKQWRHEAPARTQFDWRILRDLLVQRKIAFLVDEIGSCKSTMIAETIRGFHSLADWAPRHMKLVVSFEIVTDGRYALDSASIPW